MHNCIFDFGPNSSYCYKTHVHCTWQLILRHNTINKPESRHVDVGPFTTALCGQKSQNSSHILNKAVWGLQSDQKKHRLRIDTLRNKQYPSLGMLYYYNTL